MAHLLQIEHTEQVNLIKWWSLVHKQFGISEHLLFAIPNGGQRNIIVASKLKAEGVRSGVPDLFLAVPKKDYHGLFIEMKKPKGGRVSGSQKEMIDELNQLNYLSVVCKGWNEAKAAIEQYLK
jgi:hypothetical protein